MPQIKDFKMAKQQIEIKTYKTARICTNTSAPKTSKYKWFVLHGYGQLSPYFIEKFNCLPTESHFVIAPEALSRYYLNGTDGRVGATWMTKEARLQDIADYVNYLDQIFEHYKSIQAEKTIVLGFSQGAATACRWINLGKIKCDILILWAGVYPPDLSMSGRLFEHEPKTYILYGNKDLYITETKLETQKEAIQKMGLKPEIIHFEGTHEIPEKVLTDFVKVRI